MSADLASQDTRIPLHLPLEFWKGFPNPKRMPLVDQVNCHQLEHVAILGHKHCMITITIILYHPSFPLASASAPTPPKSATLVATTITINSINTTTTTLTKTPVSSSSSSSSSSSRTSSYSSWSSSSLSSPLIIISHHLTSNIDIGNHSNSSQPAVSASCHSPRNAYEVVPWDFRQALLP